MKFITRKVHSVLDYLVSLIIIMVPFIAGADKHAAGFVAPVVLGTLTILISLFTNYEGGVIKAIPFRIHLVADVIQALMLGSSPWVFELGGRMTVALTIIAILEIGVVLCTDPVKQPAVHPFTVHRLNRLRQKWNRQ